MITPIGEIVLDHRLQPREAMHQRTIDEYAEQYESSSSKMPALVAFRIDGKVCLADGHHRLEAAKKAGLHEIDVEVLDGDFRDARRYICSANATHGLRRTNGDKKRQVRIALETDPELSDREIARQCGVDHVFVGKIRKTVSGDNHQIARKAVRNGTSYTIETSNIGNSSPMAVDTFGG